MVAGATGIITVGDGAEESLRIGSRFGPEDDQFQLGEEIGSGAAARVYVCTRLSSGEQFAAKIINLQRLRLLGDFDSHMEKLDREVQILRELRHPRIVRLHIVHRTQFSVFLVMELVRGGELFDRIVQSRCLTEVEAKYIFRQLLEGVAYMHSRHVIHRDLKPENILISSSRAADPAIDGSLLEVKIADFGLSKIISEESSWAKTFVGTPQYWAPEVLRVKAEGGSYTQAVDFWSLGAVLFVMLSGRYPFDGKKMPLEEQIRTASYNMSAAAWQRVSEEAKSMVRGLLVVDPLQRFNAERCLNHAWLSGRLNPPPRPSSPISRTASVMSTGHAGPIVTEVSQSNAVTNNTPLVTQPSSLSENSGGSGSGVNASSPNVSHQDQVGPGEASHARNSQPQPIQVTHADMPHENIFCLNELLKLQVSIAGSLEMAALAFRHTDIELADAIRKTFRQARDLSTAAVNVVSQYAQVAHQVSNDVLPDLELAVQEREPNLAHALLAMVKDWVSSMKKDGQEIQCAYHGLQESVHSLIQRAQRTKMGADLALAEAFQADPAFVQPSPHGKLAIVDDMDGDIGGPGVQQVGGSSSSRSPAPGSHANGGPSGAVSFAPEVPAVEGAPGTTALTLPVAMTTWTHKLFEQLTKMQMPKAIQDQATPETSATVDVNAARAQFTSVDSEAWKRDVLDLLFMAPGVLPSHLHRVESVNCDSEVAESRNASSSDTDTGGRGGAAQSGDGTGTSATDEVVVRYAPGLAAQSAAEAMSQSSASLLRALRELKRVDEILEGCSAFWANMDGTVQKLAQMKEHTDCLVNFASNSKPLRERFEQRLGEYRSFWSSLELLCRRYCLDHQASAKRMYEVIREVSDAADVFDTAHSARLGLLGAMREKQRRHGY